MVMADPYANKWNNDQEIAALWERIKGGRFVFGDPSDKAATVISDFQKIYGRNPTTSEIALALPAAQSGQGAAFIAQQKQAEDNSPAKVQAREQAEIQAKAPQFADQVNQIFKASGRDASDAEKQHFGSLLASGQLDAFTLGQFVQQLPEFQNKADAAFRQGLSGELQSQGERYFSEKILPSIQANLLKAGRSQDSSGYAAMLAKEAGNQNLQREAFLSNLSANQYQGNKDAARADYGRSLDQYYGGLAYNRERSDYLRDSYMKRSQELQDYQMQKQAYDEYLRRYGKRKSPLAGAIGGMFSGGMTGGMVGGPWGAVAGAAAGGALGGFAGGQ